jgi:hypothetical protein
MDPIEAVQRLEKLLADKNAEIEGLQAEIARLAEALRLAKDNLRLTSEHIRHELSS